MNAQRGMALIVALIMLTLLTVICLATFNIGRTGLDVIGNMQRRNEVVAAANAAIEQAISTQRMFQSPNAIFPIPCGGVQNKLCYDLNNDGVFDIEVMMSPAPTCLQSQRIPNSTLNLQTVEDLSCIKGSPELWAIEGVPSGDSLCANTMWELSATAQDNITAASTTVTQGVAVRVSIDDIATACP